jgi:hypothetical protein
VPVLSLHLPQQRRQAAAFAALLKGLCSEAAHLTGRILRGAGERGGGPRIGAVA